VEPLRDGFPVFTEVLTRRGHVLDRTAYDRAEALVGAALGTRQFAYLGKSPGFWDTYHGEVLGRLGVTDPGSAIVAELHQEFTSPERHRPYPESAEVLTSVRRRGFDLHLVSNNTEYLPEIVGRLGWTGRFGSITYSQEAGAEKPDERVFRLALARAGCAPDEVLHVGDSWTADVLGSRGVGISPLWVDRSGRGPSTDLPWARDLRGVLDHLERLESVD
jgi:putative hydrolase of the HAD superfamily